MIESYKMSIADRKIIGSRLRAVRKARGYSQAQVADIVGFSQTAWQALESGKNMVTAETLWRLFYEIGVSADWVLFGRGEMMDETIPERIGAKPKSIAMNRLMNEKGLTRLEVAQIVGKPIGTVNRWFSVAVGQPSMADVRLVEMYGKETGIPGVLERIEQNVKTILEIIEKE